jgi:protein TonB
MKRFIYIALMMLIPVSITAQTYKKGTRKRARVVNVQSNANKVNQNSRSIGNAGTKEESDKVYEFVEELASFPGGPASLNQWLAQNIRYPAMARNNNIQGRVTVSIIIEKDGSISNAEVVRGIDPSLDKEAIRVVYAMPKWNPGKQNGKIVRSKYTLPVNFKLTN